MDKWVETSGWLKGYAKTREKSDAVIEQTEALLAENAVQVIIKIKCPRCVSKKIKCYGKDKPVLYYRCLDCGKKFKVIEKD
jgi:transposase-like protein